MKFLTIIMMLFAFESNGQNTVNSSVPDPGEKGEKTLLGIDSDKDGIRDDVQIWINKEYPFSSFPSTNQALKQLAKYFHLELQHHLNKDIVIPYHIKMLESLNCIAWVRKNGFSDYRKIKSSFKAEFFNTPERTKAFLKVNSYRHGSQQPQHIAATDDEDMNKFCEFKATKE